MTWIDFGRAVGMGGPQFISYACHPGQTGFKAEQRDGLDHSLSPHEPKAVQPMSDVEHDKQHAGYAVQP